jgi:hypothetical protein
MKGQFLRNELCLPSWIDRSLSHFFIAAMNTSTASESSGKRRVHFVVRKFSYFEPPARCNEVDLSQLYYSREEYAALAFDINMILRAMRGSEERTRGQNELCYRGLENRTKYGHQRRRLNCRNAVQAVIKEQEHQRENDEVDADKLSKISKYYSDHCTKMALSTAVQDASAAKQILQEPIEKESTIEIIHSNKNVENDSPGIPRKVTEGPRPPKLLFKRFFARELILQRNSLIKTNAQ